MWSALCLKETSHYCILALLTLLVDICASYNVSHVLILLYLTRIVCIDMFWECGESFIDM